jgi:CheY-like chemotaxis protein
MPSDSPRPESPLPNVPIIHRPGATIGGAPLARPPLADRKRLLVVDDERPIVDLVVRILASENYDIRAAESGPAALRLLEEAGDRLDLLVTDLKMPEMSGRELAQAVRNRCPSVRVLYQTGYADTLFAGLPELGAGEAYLEKPFSPDGLLEATRLLMFGQISDAKPEEDRRDHAEEWEDRRLRARIVRFLRRLRIA